MFSSTEIPFLLSEYSPLRLPLARIEFDFRQNAGASERGKRESGVGVIVRCEVPRPLMQPLMHLT